MGCVSSDETKILAFDDFQFLKSGTLSIELTQLIFVVNNLIKEAHQLYKQVDSIAYCIIIFGIQKKQQTLSQVAKSFQQIILKFMFIFLAFKKANIEFFSCKTNFIELLAIKNNIQEIISLINLTIFEEPSFKVKTTKNECKNQTLFFTSRQNYFDNNRIILFRITKISLTANQTLIDAFGFWTRFVSICNLGEGKKNGVFYQLEEDGKSLSYNLGLNGDLKLQWFGEVLNDYLKAVVDIIVCIPLIVEQLTFLKEKINHLGQNLKEKNKQFNHNMLLLKFNLNFSKIVNIKILKYNDEIEFFKKNYQQIVQTADEQGLKLYQKYGAKQTNDRQKYRMKVKINLIMEQCFQGQMRSEIDQDFQNQQKEKRKALKPAWTFGDDIGIGVKKFPFRVRWTGCNCVDHSFFIISHYLENHSKHLLLLRKLSVMLRYLTQSYKTDEDSLPRSWFIFCKHLTPKERTTIQTNSSIVDGLKKIKLKNSQAEKCRLYFIQYIQLLDQKDLNQLQEEWQDYLEGQAKVLSLWSNNQIFATEEFKALKVADKYYALTSMSKNVYALQTYYSIATQIYNSVFQKKLQKGQIFLNQLSQIYNNSEYSAIPFDQLYTLNQIEEDQAKVKTKEIKFHYAFTKFEKKQ